MAVGILFCITCPTDAGTAFKVLEDMLCKDTSDHSDHSGITIKFALAAAPCGDVHADERQAMDAITKATDAINPLPSTPTSVEIVGSTVDTGTSVVTEVQTFENTWAVLLRRLGLFNKIVTGVAQIHPYTSLAWSVISAANNVCLLLDIRAITCH